MATFFLLFSVFFLAGISIAVASYYLLRNRRTLGDRDDRFHSRNIIEERPTRSVV